MGFPEQRLAYLADKIKALDAQHCVILKPRSYVLLGLVRFSEVAAHPEAATRIFSEIMQPKPAHQVLDTDPVDKVIDFLEADPHEIAVVKASGEYVGLITPDSFVRWLLTLAPPAKLSLEKIPANSRWHPYAKTASSAPPFKPE